MVDWVWLTLVAAVALVNWAGGTWRSGHCGRGSESRAFLASGSAAALWGVAIGAPLLLAPQDGLPLAIAVGVLVVLVGLRLPRCGFPRTK